MDYFLVHDRGSRPVGKALFLEHEEMELITGLAQERDSLAVGHTADVHTIHLEEGQKEGLVRRWFPKGPSLRIPFPPLCTTAKENERI